jgi:hypothetical protein
VYADTSTESGLLQAISVNTWLWGGQFNPVIPALREVPPLWTPNDKQWTPQQLADAAQRAFDPDIVIATDSSLRVGITIPRDLYGQNQATWILDPTLDRTGERAIGVQLDELIADFIDRELKFKRQYPIDLVIPTLPEEYRLFGAALYGYLMPKQYEVYAEMLEPFGLRTQPVEPAEAFNAMENCVFPRSISKQGLKRTGFLHAGVFLLRRSEVIDYAEFWAVRATGAYVLPLPIELLDDQTIAESVRRFAENWRTCTVFAARGLEEDVYLKGYTLLGSMRPVMAAALRSLPFVSESDVLAARIEHRKREVTLKEDDAILDVAPLEPSISLQQRPYGCRWANVISLRRYGAGSEPPCEIVPAGARRVAARDRFPLDSDTRYASDGLVFIKKWHEREIRVPVPDANLVVRDYLARNGWSAEASDDGLMARRLLHTVGNLYALRDLSGYAIRKLFDAANHEGVIGYHCAESTLRRIGEERNAIRWYLGFLIETNVLALGIEVQCPACARRSWYSLDDVAASVRCTRCAASFTLPGYDVKQLAWSYKLQPPLNNEQVRNGLIAVAATISFFQNRMGRLTIAPGVMAHKGNENPVEIDLIVFEDVLAWDTSQFELIFVECKAGSRFEDEDFRRMRRMRRDYPQAVFAFATLREWADVTPEEVAELRRFANESARPYGGSMILTHDELRPEHERLKRHEGKPQDEYEYLNGALCDIALRSMKKYLGLTLVHDSITAGARLRGSA